MCVSEQFVVVHKSVQRAARQQHRQIVLEDQDSRSGSSPTATSDRERPVLGAARPFQRDLQRGTNRKVAMRKPSGGSSSDVEPEHNEGREHQPVVRRRACRRCGRGERPQSASARTSSTIRIDAEKQSGSTARRADRTPARSEPSRPAATRTSCVSSTRLMARQTSPAMPSRLEHHSRLSSPRSLAMSLVCTSVFLR